MANVAQGGAMTKVDPLAIIGKRILEQRTILGLTQVELAERLHLSRPTFVAIERGKKPPGRETKRLLGEIFGENFMTQEVAHALSAAEKLQGNVVAKTAHGGDPQPFDYGIRIKEFRERAGYSPEHLAAMIDVHVNTIYRWEDGRSQPNWGTIERLERIFGFDFIAPDMWRDLTVTLQRVAPTDFGPRLKHFRLKKGLSTQRFATLIDVAPTSLTHWERSDGYPAPETYDRIVEVLGKRFPTPDIAARYASRVRTDNTSRRGRPLPPLPPEVPVLLKDRIRYFRIKAGFSVDRFAKVMGASRATIVGWENGRHKPDPTFHAKLTATIGPKWKPPSEDV